ncbi:MAG TPA: HAD family phosphatase [Vicinamibacterales bacterium]
MTLEAVVFDFDGVLANSEPLHLQVYQVLLADEGIPFTADEYYAHYLGYDDIGVFQALQRNKGLRVDGRMQTLIDRKSEIFQSLVRRGNVLFPGAEACLRQVAAAVPVAIASGALRDEIELILRGGGLDGLVPIIVASGDTPQSKPAPDPYERAVALLAERTGAALSPQRIVAIEDSRWGLESARGAGLRTIGVTTSYPAEELPGADLLLPDISHVTLDLLDRLVAGAAPQEGRR